MESLDYRYYDVTFNKHTARYFADGSIRLVVCATNPNTAGGPFLGNWIDTAGHRLGTMCFRWIKPAPAHDGPALPRPRTRVVLQCDLINLDAASAK